MASNNSSPTAAQSTLNAFQQELFTIMNNLQTQANNEATTEASAFSKYLKEEEALVAKSIDFGGPSPNFTYPTWEGSTAPNGSKSYEKVFNKIITKTLSQKTASQEEHALMLSELQTNLVNVFKKTFLGITPAPSTSLEIMKWVQDSIISANSLLDVSGQEGLVNAMTDTILGSNPSLPSGTTFDKAASGGTSFQTWVKNQLKAYYKQQKKKNNSSVNVQELTNQILKQLSTTIKKYKLSSEDSIKQWVQTTISTLPPAIKVSNFQKDELIGALELQVGKMFPQPDASFFYSNLQEILLQNIFNPPKAAMSSPSVIAPQQLSVLLINTNSSTGGDGSLQAVVTGGTAPYEFSWEREGADDFDHDQNDAGDVRTKCDAGNYTVYVVDSAGSKAKGSGTLFKSSLALKMPNPVTNVKSYGENNGQATVVVSGGTAPYKFSWYNPKTDKTEAGTTDADGTSNSAKDLAASTYTVVVTDKNKSTANIQVSISEPKFDAGNGLKSVIEQILRNNYVYDPSSIAGSLEHAIEKIVQIAIAYTFNNLAEFGAQGQLMSSTYDYQMISRVSDYTMALINALEKDYEVNIPKNSANALTAAQDITSAAVAFRNFAISLTDLESAFDSENNHITNPTSAAGKNYNQIKNLITNNANPYVKTLEDLGETAYLSTKTSNVPLVKTAELNAVKLASSTAGLNTSLSKLLTSEQAAAIAALKNMKDNAKANFGVVYQNYNREAENYFTQLDNYISANQDFNLDIFQLESIQNAINSVSTAIATGVKHGGYTKINAKS